MSLGPELVHKWVWECNTACRRPRRVQKIEGGVSWLSLSFSDAGRGLFFSWDSSSYGCASASEKQLGDILSGERGRHPLISALRAHLQGSFLTSAEQVQEDRILSLTFHRTVGSGFTVQRKLFFEAMERYSNLIFADENGLILECAKHIHPEINRYRTIIPGQRYAPPPPWKGRTPQELLLEKAAITREDFLGLRGFGKPLLSHLWKYRSSPGGESELEQLQYLREDVTDCTPRFLGEYLTVFPGTLPESTSFPTQSALEAAWHVTGARLLARYFDRCLIGLTGSLSKERARIEKELSGVAEQQRRFLAAEEHREKGELLLTHGREITQRSEHVRLPSWRNPGEIVDIPLDPKRSIAENAQNYFKTYKKWKAYGAILETRTAMLSRELEEITEQESVLFAIDDMRELRLIEAASHAEHNDIPGPKGRKKRASVPPPHLVYKLPGGIFFVGLNAKGNRYVTFHLAGAEDLWFHAQGVPGAHVVARLEKLHGEKRERFLHCAASLAAHYGKSTNAGSVLVDCTEKKHVRHIPGKGLSHVRYEAFRTLRVDPRSWRQTLEELQQALEEDLS